MVSPARASARLAAQGGGNKELIQGPKEPTEPNQDKVHQQDDKSEDGSSKTSSTGTDSGLKPPPASSKNVVRNLGEELSKARQDDKSEDEDDEDAEDKDDDDQKPPAKEDDDNYVPNDDKDIKILDSSVGSELPLIADDMEVKVFKLVNKEVEGHRVGWYGIWAPKPAPKLEVAEYFEAEDKTRFFCQDPTNIYVMDFLKRFATLVANARQEDSGLRRIKTYLHALVDFEMNRLTENEQKECFLMKVPNRVYPVYEKLIVGFTTGNTVMKKGIKDSVTTNLVMAHIAYVYTKYRLGKPNYCYQGNQFFHAYMAVKYVFYVYMKQGFGPSEQDAWPVPAVYMLEGYLKSHDIEDEPKFPRTNMNKKDLDRLVKDNTATIRNNTSQEVYSIERRKNVRVKLEKYVADYEEHIPEYYESKEYLEWTPEVMSAKKKRKREKKSSAKKNKPNTRRRHYDG